jgi:hypothetical protein
LAQDSGSKNNIVLKKEQLKDFQFGAELASVRVERNSSEYVSRVTVGVNLTRVSAENRTEQKTINPEFQFKNEELQRISIVK